MTAPRAFLAAVLARGVISAGWYAILTGLAMLYVAFALSSVADDDRAAPLVAIGFLLVGVWSLRRGVLLELRRRSSPGSSQT